MPAPNVPILQRSSIAQQVLVHRFQVSSYISKLRNYGLAPDYPYLMAPKKSAPVPVVRTLPAIRKAYALSTPASSAGGTMQAPRRFTKALRNPLNAYSPETY